MRETETMTDKDTARKCSWCGYALVQPREWRKLTTDQRRDLNRQGWRQASARGMCATHYGHALRRGELVDHERQTRSRTEVLAEWEHLAGEVVGMSRTQAAEYLAPRMGMTAAALHKHLERHKLGGLPAAANVSRPRGTDGRWVRTGQVAA